MARTASIGERSALDRRAPLRLIQCIAGFVVLAAAAQAQELPAAELGRMLGEGVRCQDDDALTDLTANVAKAQTVSEGLMPSALALLAADETTCEPVRTAALTLASQITPATEPAIDIAEAARAVVEAARADAERRAASLKFEVGPPPLNLTRGRKAGS